MHLVQRFARWAATLALLVMAGFGPSAASAQPVAANCAAGQQPAFVLGFAQLKAQIGDIMGEAEECEQTDPMTGDSLQRTTTGLAFYRRCSNAPTFTNGYEHWALTADGLVSWTGTATDPPLEADAPSRPVDVVATGFSGNTFLLIAENRNTTRSVEYPVFDVSAMDAGGSVLASTQAIPVFLLPCQRAVSVTTLAVPPGATVARIQVQPGYGGTFRPAPGVASLGFESGTYAPPPRPGGSASVSGIVVSPYESDVADAEVTIVAYDAAGAITGVGGTNVPMVPAGGRVPVQVALDRVWGVPARLEAYVGFTSAAPALLVPEPPADTAGD